MGFSIEICYNNRIYIWKKGEGILDRDLNKVDKKTERLIINYLKKMGLILDNAGEVFRIDFN